MLTEQFNAALCFAAVLHKSQLRKGTKIPYIGHLLAVAALVIEDGGSEDEAIAALLHDAIEDQGLHYPGGRNGLRAKIKKQFGPSVAAIVDACTDDDEFEKESSGTAVENWFKRKRKYAESIAHKTSQALRVTTADKVHNVESILDAHNAIGTEVWNRFQTKSRRDQIDVYRDLAEAIAARNDEFPVKERIRLTKRLLRAVDLLGKLT